MPSPFPGVDPYVESHGYWPDFHKSFMVYCSDAINEHLPDDYYARIDERVNLVSEPDARDSRFRPDVAEGWRRTVSVPAAEGEPVPVTLESLYEERQVFIKILHHPDRSLVTVIELLSPADKDGPGRVLYLARRNDLLVQPVHLVELDFLLGGARLPTRGALPPGDYYATVARADHRPVCGVYDWTVRKPFPKVGVPLLPSDPDIPLDLAALFTRVYDRGLYARTINYAAPLGAGVALSPEDRAWAEGRAREARC
jgi:hypothetical protein